MEKNKVFKISTSISLHRAFNRDFLGFLVALQTR